jgi:TonB family protein
MRLFVVLAGFAIPLSSTIEAQTPPPLLARPVTPTAVVTATIDDASKVAVFHPTPLYPAAARQHHITGKGVFHVHVSYETGDVTSIEIVTSTGHRLLDDSVVATFKRWKFRPHTVIGVKVPITFSMSAKT